MSRGNGLAHTEKCRKFREKIQNLEMDLEELQEKFDKVQLEKANLKKKFDKLISI